MLDGARLSAEHRRYEQPLATIDFYWDVGSTNTYFALHLIRPIAEKQGANLVMHPFNLGYVFRAGLTTMVSLHPRPGAGSSSAHPAFMRSRSRRASSKTWASSIFQRRSAASNWQR